MIMTNTQCVTKNLNKVINNGFSDVNMVPCLTQSHNRHGASDGYCWQDGGAVMRNENTSVFPVEWARCLSVLFFFTCCELSILKTSVFVASLNPASVTAFLWQRAAVTRFQFSHCFVFPRLLRFGWQIKGVASWFKQEFILICTMPRNNVVIN